MMRPGLWTPERGLPDGARAQQWLREERRRWRHIRDPRLDPILERRAAITLVQASADGSADGSDSNAAASLTGVGAGHLIAVFAGQGLTGSGITVTGVTDGTTALTGLTAQTAASHNLYGQWWYLLSANSGNQTYTATFSSAAQFRRIRAWEFSFSGSISRDDFTGNAVDGGSSSLTTGNITTTGTDEVVLCGAMCQNAAHFSAMQFDSVDGDNTSTGSSNANTALGSNCDVWYRILSATVSAKQGTATSPTSEWVTVLASFKAVSAGVDTSEWRFSASPQRNRFDRQVMY